MRLHCDVEMEFELTKSIEPGEVIEIHKGEEMEKMQCSHLLPRGVILKKSLYPKDRDHGINEFKIDFKRQVQLDDDLAMLRPNLGFDSYLKGVESSIYIGGETPRKIQEKLVRVNHKLFLKRKLNRPNRQVYFDAKRYFLVPLEFKQRTCKEGCEECLKEDVS